MAHVRKKDRGSYLAVWRGRGGETIELATGCYDFEGAQKKANQLEAKARFLENHEDGIWQLYANMGFSPKYCHESFTHAKHLRFDAFKSLLDEVGVTFQKRGKFRDAPKKKPGGKKYLWRGKKLTLGEIIEKTGASINAAALRWRLDRGWSLEDAVTQPVMSRSEAGTKGANKTNEKRGGQRA